VKREIVVVASVAVVLVAWAACVFPDGPVYGEACTSSTTCPQGTVCQALDPAKPGGEARCLPMPKLDAVPVHCTEALDCSKAGYPIDASCLSGSCACDDTVLQNCEATIAANDEHHESCTCPPPSDAGVGEGEGEGEGE
jgi:hypothetical protein